MYLGIFERISRLTSAIECVHVRNRFMTVSLIHANTYIAVYKYLPHELDSYAFLISTRDQCSNTGKKTIFSISIFYADKKSGRHFLKNIYAKQFFSLYLAIKK